VDLGDEVELEGVVMDMQFAVAEFPIVWQGEVEGIVYVEWIGECQGGVVRGLVWVGYVLVEDIDLVGENNVYRFFPYSTIEERRSVWSPSRCSYHCLHYR
jgi:hypothetical protein